MLTVVLMVDIGVGGVDGRYKSWWWGLKRMKASVVLHVGGGGGVMLLWNRK